MQLRTEGLTFQTKNKMVMEDITLTFSKGILYALLGPNGAGKSTFFKTLTGIWTPTRGRVLWNDVDLLKLPRAEISRIMTLVPQHPQLFFDFTAYELVAMGRYSHSSTAAKDRMIIENALIQMNGWHLRDRYLSQLSGGERQRMYIARALATEAPILLFDEPTSSLDLRHQLEIWHLLKKLVEQGKIAIVAIHDLMAAKRFCEHLIVFNQGRCIAQGSYQCIMTPQLLQTIFGVNLNSALVGDHFELIHQAG